MNTATIESVLDELGEDTSWADDELNWSEWKNKVENLLNQNIQIKNFLIMQETGKSLDSLNKLFDPKSK